MIILINTGIVFDIQRFSLHDGPGTRTVVFLKGCPLQCKWCHNPEGQKRAPEILYHSEKCIGCGACTGQCKAGLHKTENGLHMFDRYGCAGCGKCAEECSSEALRLAGTEMTVGQVMNTVEKDRIFYGNTGGITLSGGEPMMQADFSLALLRKAKESGISTCMETCGYAPAEAYRKILPDTDIFLYDYKVSSAQRCV